MGDTQNNQEGGYWGWLSAAATKAQELAETAKKVAQEQAAILAKQAEELREKYDLEVATSMFTGGTAPPKGVSVNSIEIKLTKADLNQLDMIYITENLLAMAFPREREEIAKGKGRIVTEEGHSEGNDINVVAAYLKKKHSGKFMIWNISEESYDYTKFQDQVLEYRFPGHPAPPLGLLFKICTSIESWLDADESNIAIVHCLTGKGRTATLIACALAWLGEFDSPMQALQYVAQRRGTAVDYLTIPSQRRYIQYFSNLLDGVKPSSEPLLLRRIIVNSIPGFGFLNPEDPSTQGCCPYLQLFKNGKLIASAAAVNEKSEDGAATMKLRWVPQSEGSATFKIDCVVQGDVLLRCRHASVSGTRVSMFRAAFHTGYISGNVLRLTRAQLDGTASDTRYAEDFFVDLIFAPVDQTVLNETTTNKELLDAAAHDKYELGLHKDAKFWESVTARKNKGKKRKSRKFTSDQADPFSIFDDGKLSGDDQDEIDFKITKINTANQVPVNNNDELIKQLAQLEGDNGDFNEEVLASPTASTSSNKGNEFTSPPASTAGETQTLEDLEKELGLSDLQLFTSSEKPKAASVTATPNDTESTGHTKVDEDNLDELERYLQSLSSQN